MKNIKKKFNIYIKWFKFLIKKTLLKHLNKINNIYLISIKHLKLLIKKTLLEHLNKTKYIFANKSKVSNFNIYLISLIGLLFIYLFYLSIPALYDKSWVQNTIQSKLSSEFKVNFSISSEISYEILPYPHFTIKNIKILNDNVENPKELAEIKKLKVFISQKNFFNKEKLHIKNILIDNANFLVQQSDFSFFDKLFNNKFSEKKINIKNSNIFFKNIAGETVSITQISKVSLFYDNSKIVNKIFLKGEMFKIPFIFELNKDLVNRQNDILIDSKKYKIQFKNQTTKENDIINGLNNLLISNIRLISKYRLKDSLISFKSFNSQLRNNKIEYKGELNLRPFNFVLDVNLQKIDLKKLLNTNSIFFELLKSGKLFHENLSLAISLNSSHILNNKIFSASKFNFKAINGEVNFDNSYILSNKIGSLTLTKSNVILNDDNSLFINGDFNLDIKSSDYFFSFFQTKKKFRIPIKNITFKLDLNVLENKIMINNFKIDNVKPNESVVDILNNFNSGENQQIKNLIIFKNLVNNLFSVYDG